MTLTLFSRILVGVDGSPLDSSHSITRTGGRHRPPGAARGPRRRRSPAALIKANVIVIGSRAVSAG